MMSKYLFNMIGGFNENYIECFEDVHLNIDCLNINLKNYLISDAVCYHYESQTRNLDPNKNTRLVLDYTERLLPKIMNTKKIYKYFDNISEKDITNIINNTLNKIN
jgi:hypothetical protein